MATKLKAEPTHHMTAEEIAAVKEGLDDFAAGRVLTEEQFEAEMDRYFERREKEIAQNQPSHRQ